ncbi:DUF1365 domain-containing protein [Salipiger aestuarii]|uniref:DUF1365 domain-containing protein n=1 Tax=Salipiger aestuarii TaxID=568098 RepID=UPI001239262A|nr:DUF1365 domain-containing protein [Salipiger aestuarii]KAA8616453.1 cyclopropane-fatty-acyl-phospholipid synthase [Salipiger aestuarii]
MTSLWHGALIDAHVWHARSGRVGRQFRYDACYLALPLNGFEEGHLPIAPDSAGIWSVRLRDHGARDGSAPSAFLRQVLAPLGLAHCEGTLVTMPRSPFYGFNPVSFWLARDGSGLRAVLAEVSSTFGEHHFYLCHHPDNRPIDRSDRIAGRKVFHVSPFLPRDGHYVFRFDSGPGRFGAWVDWVGADGQTGLQTSLAGPARRLTPRVLSRAAQKHPFQAQKIMALIHWQAAKLALRGAKFRSRPRQMDQRSSEATDRVERDV